MKTKVVEVITHKKQTSKTKYIIEAILEYKPQFFLRKKIKAAASSENNKCPLWTLPLQSLRPSDRPEIYCNYLTLAKINSRYFIC